MNPHILLEVVIISTVLASISSIISMATDHWIEATALLTERVQSNVSYGLFRGSIERQQLASILKFTLTIACDFEADACIYSCQRDEEHRQIELQRVVSGQDLDPCDQARSHKPRLHFEHDFSNRSIKTSSETSYMPYSLHLSSILFSSFGLIFSLTALTCASINLKWHPIERIFNIFGLYIWNAIAAGCYFCSLALWGALFGTHLRHNIAVTDTLRQQLNFTSDGYASLGYSYYLVIVSVLLHIINLILLAVRRHGLQMQPQQRTTHHVTINEKDTRLEFY